MATRSFHYVDVDDYKVQLRVFVPKKTEHPPKPAVVMVCGLLWLGGGILGQIGFLFNDYFGKMFAQCGMPCVQIHTPVRHIAHTRFMDMVALVTLPLGMFGITREVLVVGDALMLATSLLDVIPLLILPYSSRLGFFTLPVVHLSIRCIQWLRGAIPGPPRQDHQKDIAAAVAWAEKSKELMGSSGKLVLCGYSSGGHCAALYGVSPKVSKSEAFEAVVLISGIYGIRSHTWQGWRRLVAPVFNVLYGDILGAWTPEERDALSPECMVKRDLSNQDWYVLSAEMELMRLPLEPLFFETKGLCTSLMEKGAKVHRVTCGLNHWLLIVKIGDFMRPFCAGL